MGSKFVCKFTMVGGGMSHEKVTSTQRPEGGEILRERAC